MPKKIKWWEIGIVGNDGNIIHGGIKGSESEVIGWVKTNMENNPDLTYCIVPANDDAITEKEYIRICQKIWKEEEENHEQRQRRADIL